MCSRPPAMAGVQPQFLYSSTFKYCTSKCCSSLKVLYNFSSFLVLSFTETFHVASSLIFVRMWQMQHALNSLKTKLHLRIIVTWFSFSSFCGKFFPNFCIIILVGSSTLKCFNHLWDEADESERSESNQISRAHHQPQGGQGGHRKILRKFLLCDSSTRSSILVLLENAQWMR